MAERCRPARASFCPRARPTAPRASFPPPTASTPPAAPRPTSASARACTSAWARRWRGSRVAWPSRSGRGASRATRWTRRAACACTCRTCTATSAYPSPHRGYGRRPGARDVLEPPRRGRLEQRRDVAVVAPEHDPAVAHDLHGDERQRHDVVVREAPVLGVLGDDGIALGDQPMEVVHVARHTPEADLEL